MHLFIFILAAHSCGQMFTAMNFMVILGVWWFFELLFGGTAYIAKNWGNKFEFISDFLSSKGLKYIIKCLLASFTLTRCFG